VGAVVIRKKRKMAKVLPFMHPFNSETKEPEQDVASALTSRYPQLADLALKKSKIGDTEKNELYLRYKSS
jgi:hypothetical protein